jgi:hypothetical protein
MFRRAFGFASLSGSFSTVASAQEFSNPPGVNIRVVDGILSSPELKLATLVMIFGLGVLAIEFFLFKRASNYSIDDASKYLIITLIIIGTLMLVSFGLNNTQIAAATGLFGSIIGYLLGKGQKPG